MIQRQAYVDEAQKIRKWMGKENPNISFGFRYPDGTTHSLQEMAKVLNDEEPPKHLSFRRKVPQRDRKGSFAALRRGRVALSTTVAHFSTFNEA